MSLFFVLTNVKTWFKLIIERIETMNKKNVLTCAGGGGEPLNRVHNGRDTFIPHNYWRSGRNNVTKFDGQH